MAQKNSLSEIAEQLCVDPTRFTDKGTDHSYIEVYESLFSEMRDSAKNVLEIGINFGGSIAMWHRYFPNATVYGIDTVRQALDDRYGLNSIPSVKLMWKNAYAGSVIEEFLSQGIKMDLIIDDGPHTKDSVEFCARYYSQLLTDEGILVIEDIQSIDYVDDIKNSFPDDLKEQVQVLDRREVKGRYDDILVVLDKRHVRV